MVWTHTHTHTHADLLHPHTPSVLLISNSHLLVCNPIVNLSLSLSLSVTLYSIDPFPSVNETLLSACTSLHGHPIIIWLCGYGSIISVGFCVCVCVCVCVYVFLSATVYWFFFFIQTSGPSYRTWSKVFGQSNITTYTLSEHVILAPCSFMCCCNSLLPADVEPAAGIWSPSDTWASAGFTCDAGDQVWLTCWPVPFSLWSRFVHIFIKLWKQSGKNVILVVFLLG